MITLPGINLTALQQVVHFLQQPWPWYVAGPLIGLTVPALLLLGNKSFGISSSLRHLCAACLPARVPFFRYDWKREAWNLYFVGGILLGGLLAAALLTSPEPAPVHPALRAELAAYGITRFDGLLPADLFNWRALLTLRGFLLMGVGGFCIGFGTRYAGGCTSGHSITGISTLQWPSVVATLCFMAGGFLVAHLVLPLILSL
jgi:hypothetical protein